MFCPNCGNEVSEESLYCDKCGVKLKNAHNKKSSNKKIKNIIIGIIIVVFIVIIFIGFINIISFNAIKGSNYENNNLPVVATQTSLPAIEESKDLEVIPISKTYYSQYFEDGSGISEEYLPVITIFDDKNFSILVNLYEGMELYKGTYSVSGDIYTFSINNDEIDYTFTMKKESNRLVQTSSDSLGMTSKDSIFILKDNMPKSLIGYDNEIENRSEFRENGSHGTIDENIIGSLWVAKTGEQIEFFEDGTAVTNMELWLPPYDKDSIMYETLNGQVRLIAYSKSEIVYTLDGETLTTSNGEYVRRDGVGTGTNTLFGVWVLNFGSESSYEILEDGTIKDLTYNMGEGTWSEKDGVLTIVFESGKVFDYILDDNELVLYSPSSSITFNKN